MREQIRQRIAMLTAIRNGIDDTVGRLLKHLEFLEAEGVDSYAEYEAKSATPRRRRRKETAPV